MVFPGSLPGRTGAQRNSEFGALGTEVKGSCRGDAVLASIVGVDVEETNEGVADGRRESWSILDADSLLLRARADPLVALRAYTHSCDRVWQRKQPVFSPEHRSYNKSISMICALG